LTIRQLVKITATASTTTISLSMLLRICCWILRVLRLIGCLRSISLVAVSVPRSFLSFLSCGVSCVSWVEGF
jgi:hypothetical protein